MIRGYFDPESSFGKGPTVAVLVHIPALTDEWALIQFLIDTGSSATAVHPNDARLGFGVSLAEIRSRPDWPNPQPSLGVGGRATYFALPATYAFVHDDGHWEEISGNVDVAEPNATNHTLPSILGWDMLEQFRVTMDWPSGVVSLERHG